MKSSAFTKRCLEFSVKGFKIRARCFESSCVGDEQNDMIGLIGVVCLTVLIPSAVFSGEIPVIVRLAGIRLFSLYL